jgi:hypothetical protein
MSEPANHFDCETVSLMGRVCDEAWIELQKSSSATQLVEGDVRSTLAERVLHAVSHGERSAERLRSIALGAVAA